MTKNELIGRMAVLNQSWVNYCNNVDTQLRYGQHVLDTYYPSVRCPSIYYEQNDKKAHQMLYDHLIQGELIDDWID